MSDRVEAAVRELVDAIRAEFQASAPTAPEKLLSVHDAAAAAGIGRSRLYGEIFVRPTAHSEDWAPPVGPRQRDRRAGGGRSVMRAVGAIAPAVVEGLSVVPTRGDRSQSYDDLVERDEEAVVPPQAGDPDSQVRSLLAGAGVPARFLDRRLDTFDPRLGVTRASPRSRNPAIAAQRADRVWTGRGNRTATLTLASTGA